MYTDIVDEKEQYTLNAHVHVYDTYTDYMYSQTHREEEEEDKQPVNFMVVTNFLHST